MVKLLWGQTGTKRAETGVDQGVLYSPTGGIFPPGSAEAWNGLTAVTESPSGAEATPFYADNGKYANIMSAEDFACTIEAFMYPDGFAKCDGSALLYGGLYIGQQNRSMFGFSYRTKVIVDSVEVGYKIHVVYNGMAAPSERNNATVNDTPELLNMSWDVSTTPVAVTGYKPTAHMVFDSTKLASAGMLSLENALYGTAGADGRLPQPDELLAMFAGTQTSATPTMPAFTSPNITIPTVTGVIYKRADTNATVTGSVTVGTTTGDKLVIYAIPGPGYFFPTTADDDWSYTRT